MNNRTIILGGESGKWEHKVNGYLAPWSKLDGLKLIRYIPVILHPGQVLIVYRKIYNTYRPYYDKPTKFSVAIGFTEKVMQQNFDDEEKVFLDSINNSVLFGFILFAFIFNLFFFYVVREKVYLFYSLFLLSEGFSRFLYEFYSIFLKEHPSIYAYLNTYYWFAIFFFLTYFTRHLLKTYQYFPRWDIFLKLFNWIPLLLNIIMLIIRPVLSAEINGFGNGLIFLSYTIVQYSVLVTFFLFIRHRDKSIRLLIITVLPSLFVYVMLGSLQVFFESYVAIANSHRSHFLIWLEKAWFIIETISVGLLVVSFSINLFLRFDKLKKENAMQALERERMEKEKEIERNQLIQQQKIELEQTVEQRTAELKHSLIELKAAQNHLIQSEKMASLGELTAGIAHEIQNPLNFVNNFSDVNAELIDELKQEVTKGNLDEVIAIADDIKENEQKISLHGKRADAIVKGMLEHSRSRSGQKEQADINAMADEFMRLSYHGLRAKNKSFNAELVTHFDPDLPKIKVVQKDIGRVLRNLFNNAFYAVNEKKKIAGIDYKPEVMVTTSVENEQVIIKVKDNGIGIPDAIKEKIMQPFFTTKPTGEGTGLGLSLTYDMVVKGHGGNIQVNSVEGEGSEFIVALSLN